MRIRTLTAIAVAAYLVFLVVQLPATLVVPMLESRTDVSMSGVHGTLWSGEAAHAWFQNNSLGELHWQLRPLHLFLGRYTNRIESNNAPDQIWGEGDLIIDFGGMTLASAEIDLSVSSILALADVNLPLKFTGAAKGGIRTLRWDNDGNLVSADGEVVVNDLTIGKKQRLGSYRAVVTQSGESPFLIDLRSADNSELPLEGVAEVSLDSSAMVDILFHDLSAIGEMGSIIKVMSRKDGDHYLLQWKGNLTDLM